MSRGSSQQPQAVLVGQTQVGATLVYGYGHDLGPQPRPAFRVAS